MRKYIIFVIIILSSHLLLSGQALAHAVKLFAKLQAGQIVGVAYFAGGGPAAHCRLELHDSKNVIIAEIETDTEGKFSLPWPEDVNDPCQLILYAGPGHQATITVTPLSPEGQNIRPAAIDGGLSNDAHNNQPQQLIEELNQQLYSINQELINIKAQMNGITPQKIIAGLGYIMGLLGVALFFASRHSKANSQKRHDS